MFELDPVMVTALMFASMLLLMMLGTPLAWALTFVGGVATFLFGSGDFLVELNLLTYSAYSVMTTDVLVALPLFIFMGLMLQYSGIIDELFTTIQKLMGGVRGGLGMGTILICAIIAAMAGVSGAATVSLGIIALPAMLKRGYDKRLATGSIMAGGALGFLIPPSITMIMYAFLTKESVGRLFAGGVMPGLMLALLYIVYIFITCQINPQKGPALDDSERVSGLEKIKSLKSVILPGLIVSCVLIFTFKGITSPTEASVIGATGAILAAVINRSFSWAKLRSAVQETGMLMGLLIWIIIGAVIFSKVYINLDAGSIIVEYFQNTGLSPMMVILMIVAVYFFLGMFLDDSSILFITVPLFVPIIKELGFDPVWFGVLFVLSMQTAYLTPPFGYNLFYMRSVAPKSITTLDIYRSVTPFIILQTLGIALVVMFPDIVLWLPNKMFNN